MQNFYTRIFFLPILLAAVILSNPLLAQKKIQKRVAKKWQIDYKIMEAKMKQSLEAELENEEDEEKKAQQKQMMEQMMPMLVGMLKSMRMHFKPNGEMEMSLKNPMSGELEGKKGRWRVEGGMLYTMQEKDSQEEGAEVEYEEEKKIKIIELSKTRLVLENLDEKEDSPMKILTLTPADD